MTTKYMTLKDIITDRLLRMGLISQPVEHHSHAIELLEQDVTQYFEQLLKDQKHHDQKTT